ncbi:putative SAM-dependent methyltransferase [Hirsutella rhossiliensis]|uniref:SAM-dependent methyltransferase domain-containing protein n=1 Tax=Hirsutella rhossiliensis TaxID=111463 RepID=A0A9P8N636_9HYPO|nr:putative SAM-dependent methyltransferase domain-containing protein [Hirsutella rhossiliensis]KAH0967652.1 putative SAM-dependent methyltransferase domain-containing protein [Hirsutella rhossiliensis]
MVGKTPSKTTTSASSTRPPKAAPTVQDTRDQQRLLDVFAHAFGSVLASDDFPAVLQEIKQALFRRDFAAAFASQRCLDAYAARWSPTRALCYAAVLRAVGDHVRQMLGADGSADELLHGSKIFSMLSIGGCAAEHVAFAHYIHDTASQGALTLLDAAPWSHVTSRLQEILTSAPPLSNYASAAAKASNQPLLLDSQLSTTFCQSDVLSLTRDRLAGLVGADPLLVTLLFTLNELYTDGGLGKTTAFLRSLGGALASRSLLLVVDSPGSYSEAAVGKEKKRYPMQWLLDHTLLGAEARDHHWEKLESHDSVWFRLPEGLSYPIQLENMRYQMHLYRIHKP